MRVKSLCNDQVASGWFMKNGNTEIKICGLSTPEAVSASIDAGAQMIGFIFFEKSPRNVSVEKAVELARFAAGRVKTVCVTVNADDATLEDIVERVSPDYIQLHGSETPERVADIRRKYSLPVIKAISVRTAEDLASSSRYTGVADRLLFDAKAPAGSQLPGGNGVSFDWELLHHLDPATNWMLSGGLDMENIVNALEISRTTGIDVSSGVESSSGIKDIAKIDAFIKTVRDHDKAAAASAA